MGDLTLDRMFSFTGIIGLDLGVRTSRERVEKGELWRLLVFSPFFGLHSHWQK